MRYAIESKFNPCLTGIRDGVNLTT
jgi:hypothetical protein